MTFGIGDVSYTELYSSTARTIVSGPNASATTFNISHLPSDAVVAKAYGAATKEVSTTDATDTLTGGKSYIVRNTTSAEVDMDNTTHSPSAKSVGDEIGSDITSIKSADGLTTRAATNDLVEGDHIVVATTFTVSQDNDAAPATAATYAEVRTGAEAFVAGRSYVIHSLGSDSGNTATTTSDAARIAAAATNKDGSALSGTLRVGQKITVKADASTEELAGINSLINDMEFTLASETLTEDIEAVQAKINTARVQAGSQYAALESAVAYTTDLTAQYELGYNTVNDVNFSMETAHLAKNQILQQAATAMLAQANQGQQSLLQLIQR